DGRGFFYVHQRRPAAGERVMFGEPAVFYHLVGTPQERDRAIFRTSAGTTDIALDLTMSPDGRFLLISEGSGAHGGGAGWLLSRVHLLDLGEGRTPDPTRPLIALTDGREAAHELVGQHGSVLYFLTDRDAPRKRIMGLDVREALSRAPRLTGSIFQGIRGYTYARCGRRAEAVSELNRLLAESRAGGDVSHYSLAVVQAGLGNKDAAFAELESAFAERVGG
ncbi:MAG: hypothetical protein ACSLFK_14185, partial [Gemmatimonadaceae bacterium]